MPASELKCRQTEEQEFNPPFIWHLTPHYLLQKEETLERASSLLFEQIYGNATQGKV